jgi:hypothetical protein
MSFDQSTKEIILDYVQAHLPDDVWYAGYFDFVTDPGLKARLVEEFKAARSIYKIFRGLDATDWWQRAQIRIQIFQYASIYEAVIHHVLFDRLGDEESVKQLVNFPRLVRISIPQSKQEVLESVLDHDNKVIIPTYQGTGKTDINKVRFDDKAICAANLGLIEQQLSQELIAIYEARNAIHLHAELRKNLNYEIDMARTAYRRLIPFRSQLVKSLFDRGLLPEEIQADTELDDEG